MEKITRTIETKKATAVVTNTATFQTKEQDYIVSGSCKSDSQILKAVKDQLSVDEIAVTVKKVVTESHKYEMTVELFMELATVAD